MTATLQLFDEPICIHDSTRVTCLVEHLKKKNPNKKLSIFIFRGLTVLLQERTNFEKLWSLCDGLSHRKGDELSAIPVLKSEAVTCNLPNRLIIVG